MKRKTQLLTTILGRGFLAACLCWTIPTQADLLVSFPFNEGSGTNVADTAQGLQGYFGYRCDPAVDTVTLTPNSPSQAAGDNCITTAGNGFLMVDDTVSQVLAITNGPITIESWLYIDPYSPPRRVEGIVGYGNSYKMGLSGGRQVFTLFGIRDITNTAPQGIIPAGQWVHLAAAWTPGVGVDFFVNGVQSFTPYTAAAARPPWTNWLSIGAEHQVNNIVASLDRVRIHNAALTVDQLDMDSLNPKAPLATTKVAYNFNETSFPCQNAIAPSLPTVFSHEVSWMFHAPKWTSDTPSGLPGDYALAINTNLNNFRQWVHVHYEGEAIPLGANNTNYTLETWIKMPTDVFTVKKTIMRAPTNAPRASLWIAANRTIGTTLLGTEDFSSPAVVPNDNRWHHIAVTMKDGTNVQFFLDGALRHSALRTKTAAPNASGAIPNLLIGQESDTYFYEGLLDRVRIHNHVVAQAQLDYPAIPGLAVVTTQPADTVADLNGTATFTATVDSPTSATYQWFYRANRADADGTAVSGATTATLNLPVTSTSQEGFYYLRITNAVGVAESHAGRLMVRAGPVLSIGFEEPQYNAAVLEDQDFWFTDANHIIVRVATAAEIGAALQAAGLNPANPVHGGAQALAISGTGAATTTRRPIVGFENEKKLTVEFWARPLVGGATALTTNNTFIVLENSAATRAAAIRFGPALSIDYNANNAWVASGQTWDATGSTWYRCAMRMDYTTKTYDFLLNGVKVNTSPIPFYVNTSDSLRYIRIYRGSGQAGLILDDVSAVAELQITDIDVDGNNVTIQWHGGVGPYQLQRRPSLATGQWDNIGGSTSATQYTDTVTPGGMFYRVISN